MSTLMKSNISKAFIGVHIYSLEVCYLKVGRVAILRTKKPANNIQLFIRYSTKNTFKPRKIINLKLMQS